MLAMTTRPQDDYWEKLFASRAWGAYPPEELVRFMGRHYSASPIRSAIKVLEIGCGPGPNIWFLVRQGYNVCGIDGSSTAIAQAKDRLVVENLPHEVHRVELVVGNFSSLPWASESFDAVVDVEALYANSLAEIRATIAEIWRTLKFGGRFFGKLFGTATSGSTSGELIEPGTYRKPQTGPCTGNELAHFFARDEFALLFADFAFLSIDQSYRTDGNGSVEIFEWLVIATK